MKGLISVSIFFIFLFFQANAQIYKSVSFGSGISLNENYYGSVYIDFYKPWFALRSGLGLGYAYKILDLSTGIWLTAKGYKLVMPQDRPHVYYDVFLQVPFVLDLHKKFGLRAGLVNSFYILPASITIKDETKFYVPEFLLGISYHREKYKIALDFNRELQPHYQWQELRSKATYYVLMLNLSYYIKRGK